MNISGKGETVLKTKGNMALEFGRDNIELYDLRNNDYPKNWGAAFRTFQIFICRECASQTNLIVMQDYPGLPKPCRQCPNSNEQWHWQLEDLYNQLDREKDPVVWTVKLRQIYKLKESIRDKVVQDIAGEARIGLCDPDFVKVVRSLRHPLIYLDIK